MIFFLYPFEIRLSPDRVATTGPFFLPALLPIGAGLFLLLDRPEKDKVRGRKDSRTRARSTDSTSRGRER